MKSNLFLFIYAILKAFLPLPSLEAVLLPMCLLNPESSWIYAIISGAGTCIGGFIGYELSYRYGSSIVLKFVDEKTFEKGIVDFKKYGILSVIIGSISPFPDFILAYVAGIMKMNRWIFIGLDGGCRYLRSIMLIYFSTKLNEFFHIDRYITILSIFLLVYFIGSYTFKKKRQ